MRTLIVLLCLPLVVTACTNTPTTQKNSLIPIGSAYELTKTVVNDVKECGVANQKGCETISSSDGYEESTFNAMSNEELEREVKRLKARSK